MVVKSINRRDFVRASALAATALAVPTIVPAHVLGKASPNDTLRIGCIGTGRMGHGDMGECLAQGLVGDNNARIVAVCDLDSHRAQHAKQQSEGTYARKLTEGSGPVIDVYSDYRELLARSDIDGVTISTPDHWHALVAIAAADAGKAIYLQKPLTYSIAEGRKLVEAVQRNNVILQTGSQQRSDRRFRTACELVRNGRVGKLHTIHVKLPTDSGIGNPQTVAAPANLNYDVWLGPTAVQPYAQDRVHPQAGFSRPGWLQIESYCRGMITGWGAHMFDIAQWGHGADGSVPVEVEATGEFPERGLFNVHTDFSAELRYADGVRVIATSGDPAGVTFEGDAGSIHVTRSSIKATPSKLLDDLVTDSDVRLYQSDNHMGNFLQCARSGKAPICPVEVGHQANVVCVMVHIAMKLGRKLRWDPQQEKFLGDDAANEMLDYPHRQPWVV